MAAPNIVNVATITAKTSYLTPANTAPNVLLANPTSSGKVFKINTITAANVDGASAFDATVAFNTFANGARSFILIAKHTHPVAVFQTNHTLLHRSSIFIVDCAGVAGGCAAGHAGLACRSI